MKATFSILVTGSTALMAGAVDIWGGAYSLGPTKANIIEATTTIIPGEAPPTQNGVLFLWPGISNGTGDLVQTTLEHHPDNSWCGAGKGEWCVRASVFGWFGQRDGPGAVVKGTDAVTINYKLGANQMTWTQTVTIDSKVVTTLDSDSGPFMKGWGTGTECNEDCTATISAQKYINTTIILDAADLEFSSTAGQSGGTTNSGIYSEEGGKVWKIDTIDIPPMTK